VEELSKEIFVRSDDPQTPKFTLTMTGGVLMDVRATPSSVVMRDIEFGEPGVATFELSLRDPSGIEIESIALEDAGLFTLRRLSAESEHPARYEVRFPGMKRFGVARARVVVKSSSPETPELVIPVLAAVIPELRYPKTVSFAGRDGKPKPQQIRLSARKGAPPTITEVEDVDGLLELKILESQGGVARIQALVKEVARAGLSSAELGAAHTLIVHTNRRHESRIEITYTLGAATRSATRSASAVTAG
jgi:hypothetical protein